MAPGFPPASAAGDCSTGASALPPTVPFTSLAVAEATCEGAVGAMQHDFADAADFEKSPIAMSGQWSFGSDMPGKPPGWNGVLSADGTPTWISFPVHIVSSNPGRPPIARFEVTFLRSYEGFVDANVTINATGKLCTGYLGHLVGPWKRHQSVPFTLSFGLHDEMGEGGDGYEMLKTYCVHYLVPNKNYALNISLAAPPGSHAAGSASGGKFKVLGVAACNMYEQSFQRNSSGGL